MTQETEQKLVPVEPTEAMVRVGAWRAKLHRESNPGDTFEETAREVYCTMVAAAPPAPSGWRSMESADVLRRLVGECESFERAPDNARIWVGGWSTYSGQRDPSLVHVGEVRAALKAAPVSVGDGEAVAWLLKNAAGGEVLCREHPGDWPNTTVQPLYTHPSDPDATERIRAALAEIVALGSDGEHSGDRHARCRDIARQALSDQGGQI